MRTLGIETSCDETSAAVLEGTTHLRSNVVASQVDLHARYGGVVPELASRRHLERLGPVIDEALERAGVELADIDAVAVTCGPGLVGALTVGVAAAKTLSLTLGRRLIGVNHLEGHIYAGFLERPDLLLPALVLIVSGAHSDLVVMTDHGKYQVLGRTRDDAAGEAFDKVARALGLGYPGGPAVDRAAQRGRPAAVALPLPFPGEQSFDFSFSGLKTAVLRAVARLSGETAATPPDAGWVPDVAAAFQGALVEVLVSKTLRAASLYPVRSLLLAGGVAANSALRAQMAEAAAAVGLPLHLPAPALCTDNAGMVAAAGAYRLARGERSSLRLGAYADLDLTAPVPETGAQN
jgi:tRNA N6-adenosine threonylcarbamoyltransferase